jgi:hypothetical protein
VATFKIEGVGPRFDGHWPLDLSRLNHRDLHIIKTVAGLRSTEIDEALEAGDADVIVALAVCAMHRGGRKVNLRTELDPLWDAEFGKITLEPDETDAEEDDEIPPAGTPTASDGSGGAKQTSSGESSSQPSDGSQAIPLRATGAHP